MRGIHNHYFPTPSFLSMPSCALDISDESIKYGEIVPSSGGFALKYYGQENIPRGIVVSGKIEQEEKLVEVLRNIKKKQKIKFVRASLPEEQMYLFNIVLPNIPDKEIRETILLQLEDYIPLSASDVVFDYDILRETDAHTLIIQVVATSVILLDSYLSVFAQAGLIPLSFEVEAQAIARCVVTEDSTETIMLVDFGKTRTGISIIDNGRALFTSSFDMGGQVVTEMIAKNFKVSIEEAEKIKLSYSKLGADSEKDVFSVVVNNLSVLRDELNKHYLYWQSHKFEDGKPHPKITKIILCGGESNLYGIIPYLETSMNISVEHANTWVNIKDISLDLPSMVFGDSLSFATVFGLALASFRKE